MCGGFIGSLFGIGNDTPSAQSVSTDPTPTAMSDVGGDTSKAGSGSTKKAKGKGFGSTAMSTPLTSSDSSATGKKTLG